MQGSAQDCTCLRGTFLNNAQRTDCTIDDTRTRRQAVGCMLETARGQLHCYPVLQMIQPSMTNMATTKSVVLLID